MNTFLNPEGIAQQEIELARSTEEEKQSRIQRLRDFQARNASTAGIMLTMLKQAVIENGREFAQHQRIASELGADFYFAHPYASWERGANENMNGLIRQFFPKEMSFREITREDIEFAMHRLNHRPRKCLGFKRLRKYL